MLGPIQLLVIGFDHPNFEGQIVKELDRLRDEDLVRVVDAIAVHKDAQGNVETKHFSHLTAEEGLEFGATIGALLGLGLGADAVEAGAVAGAEMMEDQQFFDDDIFDDVIENIPLDSAGAIALLEHRWAIPLRDAIIESGGVPLVDTWVHQRDLVAVGILAAEEALG